MTLFKSDSYLGESMRTSSALPIEEKSPADQYWSLLERKTGVAGEKPLRGRLNNTYMTRHGIVHETVKTENQET